MMKITGQSLHKAVEAKILTKKQAEELQVFLKNLPETSPSFNTTNVLYYFGGLIAISAMTLFMNLGWETFGGGGILFLSLLYGLIGLLLGAYFQKKSLSIPAGICATFVVALTPLAVYGLQLAMGWWPDSTPYRDYHILIKWNWIYMEAGTLIVGLILIWIYRYPFMVMPIAFTLWYMSMDVIEIFLGQHADFELQAVFSMFFGLFILVIAFWVDIRSRNSKDYAFWLYLFGVLAFWGGLTAQHSDSEISKFFYAVINLCMIGVGVLLIRRVFVTFGAIGIILYLGHLTSQVFQDSVMFPVVLTALGFLFIYLGVLWQKHEARITAKMQSYLPKVLQELLQSRE